MKRTLTEYLDHRLGVHVGTHPELIWFCPACIDRVGSESLRQKLHINVARGIGHCYRCEYAFRSVVNLFRLINNGEVTLEERRIIRREIEPKSNSVVESLRAQREAPQQADELKPVALPRDVIPLWKDPVPRVAARALRYLEGRGVSAVQVRKHRIGFSVADRYAGYLTFPVMQDGKQVYFATRFAGKAPDDRKSNNPPKKPGYHSKATCLLGFDRCVGKRRVAIVEGPFDMLAWKHAVALMGKAISDEQVALIRRLVKLGTREIIVSLDSDAGKYAHDVYRRLLGSVPKLTLLALEDGDPFDHRDEIEALAQSAGAPSSRLLVEARYRKGAQVRLGNRARHPRT